MTHTKQEILEAVETWCNNHNLEEFEAIFFSLLPKNSNKTVLYSSPNMTQDQMLKFMEVILVTIYSDIEQRTKPHQNLLSILYKISFEFAMTVHNVVQHIFGKDMTDKLANYTQAMKYDTNEKPKH